MGLSERESASPSTPIPSGQRLAGTRYRLEIPGNSVVYEYIHVSENYMTWLVQQGEFAGVAGTERFHALNVSPQIYLVAMNRTGTPLQTSWLLDFAAKRVVEVVFGYDPSQAELIYQASAGKIILLPSLAQ